MLRDNLAELTKKAFFRADAIDATRVIELARRVHTERTRTGGFSFEVVVPRWPQPGWLTDVLLRPLSYFCASKGAPLPACSGVFVSLFVDDLVHFVDAAEVIAWAARLLGLSPADLEARYGTHESQTALP